MEELFDSLSNAISELHFAIAGEESQGRIAVKACDAMNLLADITKAYAKEIESVSD